jgi:hypothetical protein
MMNLRVGVEAYGAYALGAWLDPDTPPAARRFAKRSAIGSLILDRRKALESSAARRGSQ